MYTAFTQFVKKEKLFNTNMKLLLAFSGGADSVCLFFLLLKNGYNFSVAHCNFNLRDNESNEDEKFVKALAKKYKVPFFIQNFDTKKAMGELKLNVQETARKLRYEWFEELLNNQQFDKLLTAHHLTDNAETMLINMLRGTGIKGLHGILHHKEKIARPLMFATKKEINVFLKLEKIKFREDSSNLTDKYIRNAIRHHVLPEIEKINPQFEHHFFNTSQQIYQFETLGFELIQQLWENITTHKNNKIIIDVKKINRIRQIQTFLFYALQPFGFNKVQIEEMLNFKKKMNNRQFHSDTFRLLQERQFWILEPLKNKLEGDITTIKIKLNQAVSIGSYNIKIQKIKNSTSINLKSKNTLFLDAENLSLPFQIRTWQAGDSIIPYGMKGKQKVSNILTNKKILKSEKSNVFVMINSNKKIIALLPITVHNDYAVISETKNILAISFKNL